MQLGIRPEVLPSRRELFSFFGRSQGFRYQLPKHTHISAKRRTQTISAVAEQTKPQEEVAPPTTSVARATENYQFNTDKYAIIEVGGVQQLVEEGRWYTCNRLQAEPGSRISFGRVLAMKKNGDFHVGQPYLTNATVQAEILEEFKGPKVLVFKYKPKKHYRKKVGHRQPLSKYMITKIDMIDS
eukprot:TRINITY_DN11620_c0_g1_i3.p4 TRINITY_DN11620_c0_g1~~TRINITY_DN11620_c0_g1_i3.p4  ORF type:complete len:216 (-),score=10.41 TRINITY_DN11620_c0_g1_i3:267-818(-)